jgi:hypothetical protein
MSTKNFLEYVDTILLDVDEDKMDKFRIAIKCMNPEESYIELHDIDNTKYPVYNLWDIEIEKSNDIHELFNPAMSTKDPNGDRYLNKCGIKFLFNGDIDAINNPISCSNLGAVAYNSIEDRDKDFEYLTKVLDIYRLIVEGDING